MFQQLKHSFYKKNSYPKTSILKRSLSPIKPLLMWNQQNQQKKHLVEHEMLWWGMDPNGSNSKTSSKVWGELLQDSCIPSAPVAHSSRSLKGRKSIKSGVSSSTSDRSATSLEVLAVLGKSPTSFGKVFPAQEEKTLIRKESRSWGWVGNEGWVDMKRIRWEKEGT